MMVFKHDLAHESSLTCLIKILQYLVLSPFNVYLQEVTGSVR